MPKNNQPRPEYKDTRNIEVYEPVSDWPELGIDVEDHGGGRFDIRFNDYATGETFGL